MSVISQETIDLFDLSSVEDLVTLVPGVYTTTRYGIQGSIDVRNVPADTYFRGMKRVKLQGNARSVLAAMDTIEVVKGPPSPIFGMGKIGGYTNLVPKSGRAAIGGYLPESQGFFEAIAGTYDRREFSGGVGRPATVGRARRRLLRLRAAPRNPAPTLSTSHVGQTLVQAATQHRQHVGPFPAGDGRELPGSHHGGRAERPRHAGAGRHGLYIARQPTRRIST